MVQRSPYTPGVVASTIYGRDQVLREAKRELFFMAHDPGLMGQVKVYVGPRGIGKTSLLRAVEAEAKAEGFETAWITAGDRPLFNALLDKIGEIARSWKDEAGEKLLGLLSSLRVEAFGVSVGGSQPVEGLRPDASGYGDQMQRALVDAAETIRGRASGMVVCIDEIQSADADGLRSLAYAWQQMQAENAELPLAIFAAGLSHSQDVITDAVSFAERFSYVHLESLDREHAEEALVQPAKKKGVNWSPATLQEAVRLAGGYPYFIQVVGDLVWQAADFPDPGTSIGLANLKHVADRFQETQLTMFRSRWHKATDVEREFISAMAEDLEPQVKRGDIAERMGRPTTGISMVRRSLLDKGLIEESGFGYLRFTVPGFAEFVRNERGGQEREDRG